MDSTNSTDSTIDYLQYEKLVFKIIAQLGITQRHNAYEDCCQAGRLAIIKAIDTYDYKKAKFSTHVWWLIRKAIQTEFSKMSNTIEANNMRKKVYKHSLRTRLTSTDTHKDSLSEHEHLYPVTDNPSTIFMQNEEEQLLFSKYHKLLKLYCDTYKISDMKLISVLNFEGYDKSDSDLKQDYLYLEKNKKHYLKYGNILKGIKLKYYLRHITKMRFKKIAKKHKIK